MFVTFKDNRVGQELFPLFYLVKRQCPCSSLGFKALSAEKMQFRDWNVQTYILLEPSLSNLTNAYIRDGFECDTIFLKKNTETKIGL